MHQEKELEKRLSNIRQFIETNFANNKESKAKDCQRYFKNLRKEYDETSGNIPLCDCDLGLECVCEACKKEDYKNCHCEQEKLEEETYYIEV